MQLASAFLETTKLVKRVRELEDVDAELEEYRQVCFAPQIDTRVPLLTYSLDLHCRGLSYCVAAKGHA